MSGILRNFVVMNRFSSWLKRYINIPQLLVLALVAYVLFFSENPMLSDFEYVRMEQDLQRQIAEYEDTLRYYEMLNRQLDSDPAALEKTVRELHHMQRQGEDVYLIK